MIASIESLAITPAKTKVSQEMMADSLAKRLSLSSFKSKRLKQIFENSQIEFRYTVLKDPHLFDKDGFYPRDLLQRPPGTQKRNEIYCQEAPELAYLSAKKAIDLWGEDPKKITHVISVSCTGVMAPGIEFLLMQRCGLSKNVSRLGIIMMGCFGGFQGMMVAKAFAESSEDHKVLVVCTELCSLHLQNQTDLSTIVGNALFSDGSAAMVVGQKNSKSLWEINEHQALALDNSKEEMTWKVGDQGFLMKLTHKVPGLIKESLKSVVDRLSIGIQDFTFCIHPGGKAILEAVQELFHVEKQDIQTSYDVLQEYGNMSSCSILYVLEKLTAQRDTNQNVIGLGFGPGLSIEGVRLKGV